MEEQKQAKAYWEEGKQARKEGKIDKAIFLYSEAIRVNPKFV